MTSLNGTSRFIVLKPSQIFFAISFGEKNLKFLYNNFLPFPIFVKFLQKLFTKKKMQRIADS